jgi:hypothetical protein
MIPGATPGEKEVSSTNPKAIAATMTFAHLRVMTPYSRAPPSLNHHLPETAPNPLHSQFFRRLGDYLAERPISSMRMTKM